MKQILFVCVDLLSLIFEKEKKSQIFNIKVLFFPSIKCQHCNFFGEEVKNISNNYSILFYLYLFDIKTAFYEESKNIHSFGKCSDNNTKPTIETKDINGILLPELF